MLHILFIFLLECTQLSNADTASLPLFFIDHSILKTYDAQLKLTVHTPIRGPRVIKPDKPWESWAVFAYNHVMEVPLEFRGNDPITSSPYRLYYDCTALKAAVIHQEKYPPTTATTTTTTILASNLTVVLADAESV